MEKIKSLLLSWGQLSLKSKFYILGGFFLVVVVLFWILKPSSTGVEYEYETVKKSDLKLSVEGSGLVSTKKEITLKALSSGQVKRISVKAGSTVKRGQVLGNLDGRASTIQIAQAQANFDKVVNGATDNETSSLRSQVISAETQLSNAQETLKITIQEQNTLVKNALRNLLSTGLTANNTNSNIGSNPTISGTYTCEKEGVYKLSTQQDSGNFSGLETGTFFLNYYVNTQLLGTCGLYITFESGKSYNNTSWEIQIPNKNSPSYTSNYNAYLTSLEQRTKTITNAEQAVINAEKSLTTAKANLTQKVTQARPEDIALYQAQLDSAYLAYDNTLLKAPFDGVIGKLSITEGEYLNAGTNVMSIITSEKLAEISLNEVDIAKVAIGKKVDLTFDAINDLILPGTLIELDSQGTNSNNVITFKAKIAFDANDGRVKSGMNVTANVITEERNGVIIVPSSLIKEQDGIKTISVKNTLSINPINKDVIIKTGVSNDVYTEISEGLSVGDQVVLRSFEPVKKATKGFIQPPEGN